MRKRQQAILITLLLILAACAPEVGPSGVTGAQLHIDWAVPGEPSPADPFAGRRIKMSIPREYVKEVYRDRSGEAEKIRGYVLNGIEIVLLEVWLPDLSPKPPEPVPPPAKIGTPEYDKRQSVLAKQIGIQIEAGSIELAGLKRSTIDVLGIAGKSLYRVDDLYGLEFYRAMRCGKPRDLPDWRDARKADDTAPEGCWDARTSEDFFVKTDEDKPFEGVHITCNREVTGWPARCTRTSTYRGFWKIKYSFIRSELPQWQEIDATVTKLMDKFITLDQREKSYKK